MQGDHLSAKVTLAGCAQYDSEYARDFLTLEGSRDVLCIDTHSDTYNIPLQSLLVEIMALPSVLAWWQNPHSSLHQVDPLFFLSNGNFYQQG